MLSRLTRALATGTLLVTVTGCAGSIPPPSAAPTPDVLPSATPTPDADLPASAVLPYVPESTALLTVTDYDRVAEQLGVELSRGMSQAERDDFWRRAARGAALLSPGLLRDDEKRLRDDYGIGQEDVSWEAHLVGDDGVETGWVLRFRDGTPMTSVKEAIDAGVGPLAGARIADGTVVVKGTLPDPADSWASDETIQPLVGTTAADGVVVRRGCVAAPAGTPRVESLDAWSMTFEGALATARLGLERTDLFTRLRLAEQRASFTRVFAGGVADPQSGRLGFRMKTPAAATDLALREDLPFAVCGR